MRTPSKTTPGTLAIVLQFALLMGVACSVDGKAHSKRQPDIPLRTTGNTPTTLVTGNSAKPRWTVPIRDVKAVRGFFDTLLVMGYGSVTALNRQDGRHLWKIEGLRTDKVEGTLRSQETREATLVGVTTSKRLPQIAVFLYFQSHHAHNTTDYKTVKDTRQAELRGVELRTGKELWRSPLEFDPDIHSGDLDYDLVWYPFAVYGQTIVLDQRRTRALSVVRFMDARAGAVLNPERPQDRAFLRDSAKLYGDSYAWTPYSRLIEFNPKAERPIAFSPIDPGGYGQLIGREGNQMVFFVSTDDGGTGHSIWPNYVVCYDVRGKKIWQFPKHIPDRSDYETLMKRYDQVQKALMHPSYGKVFVHARNNDYILDARTGKTLLKPTVGSMWSGQRYEKGYLNYDSVAGLLRYIDGQTGKIRQTVPLKLGPYSRLYVADKDLLFLTFEGREAQLLCFSGASLLERER